MMNHDPQKIYFIEVLRGVAVLLVISYHIAGVLIDAYSFWPDMGRHLFRNGNIGVDIFFMISGFIICYATNAKEDNYKLSFVLRRFFRIYPLFFICLTVAWLTYNYSYDYKAYLLSATLMQNNYAAAAPFFGYNMLYQAWTISFEIAFYSIFFVSMCINHKHRAMIASSMLLVSMFVIQIAYTHNVSINGGYSAYSSTMGIFSPLLTLLGSPLMLEFALGMLCYKMYSSKTKLKREGLSIAFMLSISIPLFILFLYKIEMHGLTGKGIIAFFIFFLFMMAEKHGFIVKSTITKFLSDISYSLYLTHTIVLRFYLDYLKHSGLNEYPKGVISYALIVITCILVAYLAHVFIERPFIKLGKHIINANNFNRRKSIRNEKPL